MCKRNAAVFCLVAVAVFVLCAVSPVSASGNLNNRLSGEYDSTFTSNCLVANEGFNEDLSINGDGYTITTTLAGVTTYDGLGGYTFQGTSLVLFHPPFLFDGPRARTWNVTCEGGYEVAADLRFDTSGTCVLTDTDGNPVLTLTGINRQGRIQRAARGFMLQTSDNDGGVETYSNGIERICTGSGTQLKIK